MTTHGRVDCYINPLDVNVGNREQEMWANCVQFLTGALAQSLGIRLIASNYGTSGKGLGFWDDQVSGAGAAIRLLGLYLGGHKLPRVSLIVYFTLRQAPARPSWLRLSRIASEDTTSPVTCLKSGPRRIETRRHHLVTR